MNSFFFGFLTYSELFILSLGILLRFVVVINAKVNSVQFFEFKKYFDARHVIRWASHITVSFIALIMLPKDLFCGLISQILPTVETCGYMEAGLIGFAGYNIIKILEQIAYLSLKKIGIRNDILESWGFCKDEK